MAELDIGKTTVSDLSGFKDYSVTTKELDTAETGETFWDNFDWGKWLGYYKKIPELTGIK